MAKKEQMVEMEKIKPTIRLTEEEVPELAKWEVGKSYPLSFKKARLISVRECYDDKEILEGSFEIED